MINIFISHATEDKESIAGPLAEALSKQKNVKIWYDNFELTLGDSLLNKIDAGLRNCDYGVVILSKNFFRKHWTNKELDGLAAIESKERKIILPIWHGVTKDDVLEYSPMLAGKVGVGTECGIDRVVDEIMRAVSIREQTLEQNKPDWKAKFLQIDEDLEYKQQLKQKTESVEGVAVVTAAARSIISRAYEQAEILVNSTKKYKLRIRLKNNQPLSDSFTLHGPNLTSLHIGYFAPVMNMTDKCELGLGVYVDPDHFESTKFEILERIDLKPRFDRNFNLYWASGEKLFSDNDVIIDYAFERYAVILAQRIAHIVP